MKVRDILANKGDTVYFVNPDVLVLEALKIMAQYNIGSLVVMEEGIPLGLFSERDYARKVILKGKFSKDISVSEVMHSNPETVTEDDDLQHCMMLMTDKFIRHLPVMHNGAVAGIISIGDVVKAIITEQEFTIENLSNYISGTR